MDPNITKYLETVFECEGYIVAKDTDWKLILLENVGELKLLAGIKFNELKGKIHEVIREKKQENILKTIG